MNKKILVFLLVFLAIGVALGFYKNQNTASQSLSSCEDACWDEYESCQVDCVLDWQAWGFSSEQECFQRWCYQEFYLPCIEYNCP